MGGGNTATGGGTASGGGNATGGGSSMAGSGSFLRVGFYNQRLAAGPDGSMHLAFEDGAAERVNYAHCASNCVDPTSRSVLTLRSNTQLGTLTVGPAGLRVDAAGGVHLLLQGVSPSGQRGQELVYATCVASCGTLGSWVFTDLSSLVPGSTPITTNSTFMLASNGRLSFLTGGQFNSYSASYYSCSGACTQLGNWSAGSALNGNPLYAVIDGSGTTHVMLVQGSTTAGDGLRSYARCASNCGTASNWQVSALGFISNSPGYAAGFAVTPSGRVFMAFNQGTATVSTADNRKFFINSCSGASCLDLNSWSSFFFSVPDEGDPGTWLEASGEGLVLVSISQFDLRLRTCDAACEQANSWTGVSLLDSAAAVAQTINPDTGSACPGASESASWWPRGPRAAVGTRGAVFVHNPYAIVKCPGNPNPSRLPTIGRVVSSF